jgi:hypothetical protein
MTKASEHDRPQPARDGMELPDREEERREHHRAKRPELSGLDEARGHRTSAVRGLRASISLSAARFTTKANARAPTMATVIQTSSATPSATARAQRRRRGLLCRRRAARRWSARTSPVRAEHPDLAADLSPASSRPSSPHMASTRALTSGDISSASGHSRS